MPQLTGRFGPLPATVVLDGSGNGAVTFQPNGSNARISTLFVKVDTAENQAVATLYKGQVADSNVIGNTNSGSTGAPAFGNIDLVDGETLYVVWRGGDPGATATATFTGKTIPFDEVGDTSIRWDDPIAAGDGSLVFPAIKSPNFQSGVSGWRLSRDGDAEVNDVVVRGEVWVNGDDGSYVRIFNNAGNPTLAFNPDEPTDPSVTSYTGAVVVSTTDDNGVLTTQSLSLSSPEWNGPLRFPSRIQLIGESYDNSVGSEVRIAGDTVSVNGDTTFTGDTSVTGTVSMRGIDGMRVRVNGTSSVASVGPTPGIAPFELVTLTIPSYTYKAGRAYEIVYSSLYTASVAPNRPTWRVRKGNTVAGTQIRIGGWEKAVAASQTTGEFLCKFIVGGVDVTTDICVTLTGAAGFTATQLAGVGQPTYADVYEVGSAALYPNAPSI
jgi:hypothetical protein